MPGKENKASKENAKGAQRSLGGRGRQRLQYVKAALLQCTKARKASSYLSDIRQARQVRTEAREGKGAVELFGGERNAGYRKIKKGGKRKTQRAQRVRKDRQGKEDKDTGLQAGIR